LLLAEITWSKALQNWKISVKALSKMITEIDDYNETILSECRALTWSSWWMNKPMCPAIFWMK